MDENEWPIVSDSIAKLRAALEAGYGLQHCVSELSMYLSQLSHALWRRRAQRPIEALTKHGLATEIMRLLREALRHTESETRAEACLALDHLGDPSVVADLRPLLYDPDAMVSMRAADALRRFREPGATLVPRLIEVLSCPEEECPEGSDRIGGPCEYLQMPESHYHAARILGDLRAEAAPAREVLRATLESVSGTVRAEAAKALARIGEPPEVYLPPLRQALHDARVQCSRERVRAAEALVELGEPPGAVVPVLAELVHDDDSTGASWAMDFLGRLGPAALSAVPALKAVKAAYRQFLAPLEQEGARQHQRFLDALEAGEPEAELMRQEWISFSSLLEIQRACDYPGKRAAAALRQIGIPDED